MSYRAIRNGRLITRVAKHGLASCGVLSGATVMARHRHARRLRILMYHGVLPQTTGPAAFGNLFIEEAAFVRQIRHLQRAYCVISLDEAIDGLETGRPFPDRAVVITFDDGYRNVLTSAWPILEAARMPVAVFLPTAQIDEGICSWFDVLRVLVADSARTRRVVHVTDGLTIDGLANQDPGGAFMELSQRIATLPEARAEPITGRLVEMGRQTGVQERYPELAPASWEEWRQAASTGLITVGSHGRAHRNLAGLRAQDRLEELRESKRRIEHVLSRPCRAVAYPYGAWNGEVAEAAHRAGYACGFTTDPGLDGPDGHPFALRRMTVGDRGHFDLFRVRVSGLWDGVRAMVGPRPIGSAPATDHVTVGRQRVHAP